MNDQQQTIDLYASEFETILAGTEQSKARAKAALLEHLYDAAAAGELNEALTRLGTPETAAITFSQESSCPEATVADRFLAAAVDNLPLIILTIALLVQSIRQGMSNIAASFPPFVYLEYGGICMAPIPFTTCGVYNGGWLYAVGLPLALLWSIVGLGILESRWATTPGKRLMALQVVAEAGIRARPRATIMRRLSLLAGPLAWLDWTPVLWGDRQRLLDKVAGTKVIHVA